MSSACLAMPKSELAASETIVDVLSAEENKEKNKSSKVFSKNILKTLRESAAMTA
jgi:hypothetical protein